MALEEQFLTYENSQVEGAWRFICNIVNENGRRVLFCENLTEEIRVRKKNESF
jgi:hypothetical protein